jgi:hypothetical protein
LKTAFSIIFYLCFFTGRAQTLGGSAAYNFLKLPSTPMLTAAGGINASWQANDVGLTANNPALLHPGLNSQLQASFNSFLSGIRTYGLTGAWQYEKWNTSLGGHIYFVDYGSIPQTDAAGNQMGNFHPVDFVIQVSVARQYLEKWHYGLSLKFIHSAYGQYGSSALALDMGIHYTDSAHHVFASVLAKNMGVQLNTYAGEPEDLPFDLQLGVTTRLSKAPLGFSLTAQHLHRFNILYQDTAFDNENGLSGGNRFFNKLLNHFVFAAYVYLGNNLEATAGYNYLRRTELNLGSTGNGLNGFSLGLKIKFQKLQILYARSSYQRNISYNQFGLALQLNQIFGLGAGP